MPQGFRFTGVPDAEELQGCSGMPSLQRIMKGRVANIECLQCIPCNPCEKACPIGAIHLNGKISNMPVLDEEKCVGCGQCIAHCPGLAITVINQVYAPSTATLDFPYEYLPLPSVGEKVKAVNRAGKIVGEATVLAVVKDQGCSGTYVIRIEAAKDIINEARSIQRLAGKES